MFAALHTELLVTYLGGPGGPAVVVLGCVMPVLVP